MPVAKEIKYITGVCCGVWSENIACLWQRIALKTASAWSVWNPCLTVSITKTLMFLFLLEKDFIYFEINLRLPKCTVCFQAQHTRAVHQGHIAEGSECSFLGLWARLAKESAWDQPCGSRGLQGFGMWGHLGSTAVLQCRAMAPPQPRAPGVLHRWCCAALGEPQGCGCMRRSQCEPVKPNRSLFSMGLIWFACRGQDFGTCVMPEGRVIFVWWPLAFRSVAQCKSFLQWISDWYVHWSWSLQRLSTLIQVLSKQWLNILPKLPVASYPEGIVSDMFFSFPNSEISLISSIFNPHFSSWQQRTISVHTCGAHSQLIIFILLVSPSVKVLLQF